MVHTWIKLNELGGSHCKVLSQHSRNFIDLRRNQTVNAMLWPFSPNHCILLCAEAIRLPLHGVSKRHAYPYMCLGWKKDKGLENKPCGVQLSFCPCSWFKTHNQKNLLILKICLILCQTATWQHQITLLFTMPGDPAIPGSWTRTSWHPGRAAAAWPRLPI